MAGGLVCVYKCMYVCIHIYIYVCVCVFVFLINIIFFIYLLFIYGFLFFQSLLIFKFVQYVKYVENICMYEVYVCKYIQIFFIIITAFILSLITLPLLLLSYISIVQ